MPISQGGTYVEVRWRTNKAGAWSHIAESGGICFVLWQGTANTSDQIQCQPCSASLSSTIWCWIKKSYSGVSIIRYPSLRILIIPWKHWLSFVFNVGSLTSLWILCFQEKQVCHLIAIKHFAWLDIVYHPRKSFYSWLENGTWEICSSLMVSFPLWSIFKSFTLT